MAVPTDAGEPRLTPLLSLFTSTLTCFLPESPERMTYIRTKAFPGAWIEDDENDETDVDSNEPSQSRVPALDNTRDATAGHAPANDRDGATKEYIVTDSQLPSDDKNSEMAGLLPGLSFNPETMDIDGRYSNQVLTDEPLNLKKDQLALLEPALGFHPDAMDVDVDFKALDKIDIRVVGLYGSQPEIVAFLSSRGVIDDQTARALNNPTSNNSSIPHLRSGLYVLCPPDIATTVIRQIFVIYWPEATTWNDNAISSVRRNRVTFMRYLTKVADQVVCLISPEHARAIVWNDDAEDTPMDIEEGSDRLFTFEVAKTNEQEEAVSAGLGFTMHAPVLSIDPPHAECTLDASELEPVLVHGEIAQAILTKHYVPSHSQSRVLRGQIFNPVKLKNLVTTGCIRFGPSLTDEGIEILMGHGLNSRFPRSFEAWQARNKAAQESIDAQGKKEEQDAKQKLTDTSQESELLLREAIIDRLITLYPTIDRTVLSSSSEENLDLLRVQYNDLITLHPKLKDEMEKAISGGNGWTGARFSSKFKNLKEQLFCLDICLKGMPDLEACDREHLIKHIVEVGVDGLSAALKSKDSSGQTKGWLATFKGWLSNGQSTNEQRIRHEIRTRLATITDSQFLAGLDDMLSREPLLQDLITRIVDEANIQLQGIVQSLLGRLVGRSILIQHETLKAQIQRKSAGKLEEHRKFSRQQFDEEYQRESPVDARSLVFEGVERRKQFPGCSSAFKIDVTDTSHTEPAIECRLHTLHLTVDNQQEIQLDPKSVPSPHLQANAVQVFRLPLGRRILHAQLIDGGKLLLIIEDLKMLYIYLESPVALERAVSRGRDGARRALHRDKVGKDVSLSYDEQKRMLSLCAVSTLQLHIFVFDETFSSLQAWGSILDLRPWYTEGTFVTQSCFVCGTEEILFIDTSGQARIFSLITQQFRPASLSFPQLPRSLHSTPDGACVVVSFLDDEQLSYRAYHWATYGSSSGFDLGALDIPTSAIMTSFVNRRNVHLVSVDIDAHVCRSVVLDITKKATEFMFKETGLKNSSKPKTAITSHNSLIDCFSDVWTRFPVVAAVQRRTILSSVDRKARKLIFVTDRDHDRFKPHFSELISTFEQKTRKPNSDLLKSIQVLAFPGASFFSQIWPDEQWDLSTFRAGEFLLEILCLIPLQLAVTQENRFLPLKDGQISAAFERSLLGAEVGQIVDSISIGWYESIFQSYMTSKPVKVVSSMGEQSVGKSYALNHLADTSFAGSAMRTTEGVWMSVTPTDDFLLVSLDFEGVHSIERSAQEDALLVLFNTAISNLVLFRNNFAISRSISGLFQSFQSSSAVLDPAVNPTLFRSTLTIIIKDVVESDKNEIVREFSTKFQKIVEEEQDANFISRLHAGQLSIVPWPVIESKQFYMLFPTMKRLLEKQETTHQTAGEFLHTLKTLMAKLKANDWGSISQTLIAHRAQKLLGGLRNALMYGFFEVEPDSEPLKNFDTDELIEQPDAGKQFFLSSTGSSSAQRETMLTALQKSWDHFGRRPYSIEAEWVQELSTYLADIAELRIQQVHSWISSNLSRFKTNNANIEMLKRVFETTIVDLRTNVEICGAQCVSCQLKCLLSRRHDSNTPHDCQTTHQCLHPCDFGEEHPTTEKMCGLPAGHAGRHICSVDIHLCGEPCQLKGKPGCLGGCMKMSGHAGDAHMCSARFHKCGEPCDLKNLRVSGKPYSCPRTCVISSDEAHTQHVCDASACPLSCELCKRLCSNTDHLHGLQAGAIHLCGHLDAGKVIIAALLVRRPEYAKLKQPRSPSRQLSPDDMKPSDTQRLINFSGHPQQKHETSHGSMSKTRWAVDGPDGTALELNGRKFGSNDDGAPMMCNLVCQEMGRHAHVDYCRADGVSACGGAELEHINASITPNPARPKDWVSHSLFWRRSGFKDPYSKPDQVNFAKCDAMCSDPEHAATTTNPAQPSHCMLPLFHLPANVTPGFGYLSNDGHVFNCKNPAVIQQAYHVIFVIDRQVFKSSSMGNTDRRPLRNAPGTALISRYSNNRLGAVYSALHGFWMSRDTALRNSGRPATGSIRRDAYSVVLFDGAASVCIANDFTATPDDLLSQLVAFQTGGGTNFTLAIDTARRVMKNDWSNERAPVVIFLSDGECSIADETVRGLCRKAVALGKPLSFHAVSFGSASKTSVLRRMAQVALDMQTNAPRDPLTPAEAIINSSYSEALDTVRLAETFLGFAESLKKPRGALLSG
ncbi:VWFA domain-containing protein [Mycena sanguinolenta]|uniref:VWFA domain-containing protein n=1 Tax=Mycena sanguinolenta TaxID=230812 RepID=A0A8H6Z3M9_9AGAR|nr:VWFA domain-containing protein [Mycena sanguinolenta]